jgi:tRNA pseudouridine38-40 synthase
VRYFLKLAYRGEPFHGWQIQPNAVSVQECIEKALSIYLRATTPIVGAGRTDTGVNASMMMAHFDTAEPIANIPGAVRALCSLLGKDIVIYDIIPVADDAHARFDATSRTYHYYTYSGRSPFLYNLAWQEPAAGLDFDMMNRAAAMLLDVDDFTSFAKLHSDAKTNICRVTRAEWVETVPGDASRHTFVITADRFLRNMVRAVVGTLVDVGRGKLTLDDFRRVIDSRDRCAAGTSMPPHPLFLHDITYPYI